MEPGKVDKAMSATAEMKQFTDLGDKITVDIKSCNIKSSKERGIKRDMQIEAMIEILLQQKNSKQLVQRSDVDGLTEFVLNTEMVSSGRNFEKVGKVLGKGISSGEVILVRDTETGKNLAHKSVMLSQFNENEIRAWVKLADEKIAPELYHFRLNGDKVEFTMEALDGKTLQEVIDSGKLINEGSPQMAADFSLCILEGLLKMRETLGLNNFTHEDMHGGNVILKDTMEIKLIDFGRARKLLSLKPEDSCNIIKNEVLGIIRMFCSLYSLVDFNDVYDAKKQLGARDLSKMSKNMEHIPEHSREELFKIMNMLFDTVRSPEQEGFGDTSQVAAHVKSRLPDDIMELKMKVAVILFPKKYQKKNDDAKFETERTTADGGDDFNPIFDDPDMECFLDNVRVKDIERFNARSFF